MAVTVTAYVAPGVSPVNDTIVFVVLAVSTAEPLCVSTTRNESASATAPHETSRSVPLGVAVTLAGASGAPGAGIVAVTALDVAEPSSLVAVT